MLNLAELAVLGFASYRATQFIVWDSLLDPWRAKLEMWHAVKHTSKPRSFIRALLKCPYCIGFWLSTVTVIVYLAATGSLTDGPLLVHAVEVWAVAGIQALLNRWDDSLPGHQPEGSV
jgi:Protein of unknown function (DUF1360)